MKINDFENAMGKIASEKCNGKNIFVCPYCQEEKTLAFPHPERSDETMTYAMTDAPFNTEGHIYVPMMCHNCGHCRFISESFLQKQL